MAAGIGNLAAPFPLAFAVAKLSVGGTNIAVADAGKASSTAKTIARPRDLRPWLLLPAVVAVFAVAIAPLLYALLTALQATPNGFEELRADPSLWEAARRTLVLASVALPIELVLGLALAGVLAKPMPGRRLFVTLLALPALAAPVLSGVTWRLLFDNDYGPVNHILSGISGSAVMTLWTEDPSFAYRAVLIADIWQWTPFMALLTLAALANVSREQREAAAINDAGPWRTFFSIVLPALLPAIAVAVLIRGLDLLRLFDVVWVLTRGGPDATTETLSVFAYLGLVEGTGDAGLAALAFTTLLSVTVIAALFVVFLGRDRRGVAA